MLAPGYADLEFAPPPVGSYALPPLGEAADARVVDTRGRIGRLHELLGSHGYAVGKIYPDYVEFRDYSLDDEDFVGPNYLAVRRERAGWIDRLAG